MLPACSNSLFKPVTSLLTTAFKLAPSALSARVGRCATALRPHMRYGEPRLLVSRKFMHDRSLKAPMRELPSGKPRAMDFIDHYNEIMRSPHNFRKGYPITSAGTQLYHNRHGTLLIIECLIDFSKNKFQQICRLWSRGDINVLDLVSLDRYGHTVLYYALKSKRAEEQRYEIVSWLLSHQALLYSKEYPEGSCSHFILTQGGSFPSKLGALRAVLEHHRTQVHSLNSKNETLLDFALEQEYPKGELEKMIHLLLEYNVEVKGKNYVKARELSLRKDLLDALYKACGD